MNDLGCVSDRGLNAVDRAVLLAIWGDFVKRKAVDTGVGPEEACEAVLAGIERGLQGLIEEAFEKDQATYPTLAAMLSLDVGAIRARQEGEIAEAIEVYREAARRWATLTTATDQEPES